MINIDGKHTQFDFNSLQKCGDLIFSDGPLLSHYMSEHGDHYLAYWVDTDEKYNRWIIVRTCLDYLRQYVNREISLYKLIARPVDQIVWVTDINDHLELNNTQIISPNELPADYLPSEDSLYEFENDDPLLAGEIETYELQIPKKDSSLFTQFIDRMGWSKIALRKAVAL